MRLKPHVRFCREATGSNPRRPPNSLESREAYMAAWEELSRTEYDAVWDRFERRFEFRPSIYESDWPGIREPAPSVTFDISGFYRRDPRASEAMEWDLNLCVLEALRRCTGPSRWLYALDWQHDAYRFYPHRRFEHSDPRAWLVPVLPDGDYYIFLAEGFEFGIFGALST